MRRELTCIICPKGCPMTVDIENGKTTVCGNSCPRGEKYAVEECTRPMRTVTSAVRAENAQNRMISVKTAAPVPKESIADVMKLIRAARAVLPVNIGDVIIADVYGTDIVATERAV